MYESNFLGIQDYASNIQFDLLSSLLLHQIQGKHHAKSDSLVERTVQTVNQIAEENTEIPHFGYFVKHYWYRIRVTCTK